MRVLTATSLSEADYISRFVFCNIKMRHTMIICETHSTETSLSEFFLENQLRIIDHILFKVGKCKIGCKLVDWILYKTKLSFQLLI